MTNMLMIYQCQWYLPVIMYSAQLLWKMSFSHKSYKCNFVLIYLFNIASWSCIPLQRQQCDPAAKVKTTSPLLPTPTANKLLIATQNYSDTSPNGTIIFAKTFHRLFLLYHISGTIGKHFPSLFSMHSQEVEITNNISFLSVNYYSK